MIDVRLRRAVFVDTSAWFASLDAHDRNFPIARTLMQRLAREQRLLVVTNYLVGETFTLLRVRRGSEPALAFLASVRAAPSVRIVRVSEQWEQAAQELLEKYSDHVFSYVDATSFVAMRELGLRDVLTFDSDFAAAGFTVLR